MSEASYLTARAALPHLRRPGEARSSTSPRSSASSRLRARPPTVLPRAPSIQLTRAMALDHASRGDPRQLRLPGPDRHAAPRAVLRGKLDPAAERQAGTRRPSSRPPRHPRGGRGRDRVPALARRRLDDRRSARRRRRLLDPVALEAWCGLDVRLGSRLHQEAWPTRSLSRLMALAPIAATTIRRVQAPIQACVRPTPSLRRRRGSRACPGTTTARRICLPSSCACTRGSSFACSTSSSSVRPTANDDPVAHLAVHLDDELERLVARAAPGPPPARAPPRAASCPRRCQSSSAMCGAYGWIRLTAVSVANRDRRRLLRLVLDAVDLVDELDTAPRWACGTGTGARCRR